jgi:hypothetical protein
VSRPAAEGDLERRHLRAFGFFAQESVTAMRDITIVLTSNGSRYPIPRRGAIHVWLGCGVVRDQ